MPGKRIIDLPVGIPATGGDLFEVSQLIGGFQTSVRLPFSDLKSIVGFNEIPFGDNITGQLTSNSLFVRDPLTGYIGVNSGTPTSQLDIRGQTISGNGNGLVTNNDSPFYAVRANTGNPNYYTGWQYAFEVGGGIWGIGMNYPNNEYQFLTNGGSTAKFVFGVGNPSNPLSKFTMDLNGGYFGANIVPTATIHGKGIDSTFNNFVAKFDNSSGNVMSLRNDGNVWAHGVGNIATNTSFGLNSLFSNVFGSRNSVFGVDAMRINTTGSYCTAIGTSALYNNNSDFNTATGFAALETNDTGERNAGFGYGSLSINTSGRRNSGLGMFSGNNNQTGDDCVFVGYNANPSATYFSNAIAIGSGAVVGGSNMMALGNNVNVIIGGTTASSRLHVNGANGYNQLRLETKYTPTGTADVNGSIGDTAWDENYWYIKTSAGWTRAALTTF